MKALVKAKIIKRLKEDSKSGTEFCVLRKASKSRFNEEFRDCLIELVEDGRVVEKKNMYYLSEELNLYRAKIIKNLTRFCFAEKLDSKEQVFIPGRFSKGALLGDLVLISPLAKRGTLDDGEVKIIYKKSDKCFTGVLLKEKGIYYILPDRLSKDLLIVERDSIGMSKVGDKVIAKVSSRGARHSEHLCEIVKAYGNAQKASICAKAILDSSGANISFPKTVYDQALRLSKKEISQAERKVREDLTHLKVFTIDSAQSKDLDDAVSIEKNKDGYKLGVHIADVAHYVRFRSSIDIEAYERGTSIYYANKVIPMLPPPLSNEICSLNPNTQRLTLSVLMDVGLDGQVKDFKFTKAIIKSRVKGVYSEINKIIDDEIDDEIQSKYREVLPSIKLMYELYKILKENKIKRGAPQISTTESKIILDENENVVDIKPAKVGIAEGIIEEFMLLANESAAVLAKQNKLPFVYRIHEQPSPEKVASLKEMLDKLGIPTKDIQPKIKPSILANLLKKTKGTQLYEIMNMQVLRSMEKARYLPDPLGHFGLVLKNYAHFTSPIRRYPDLLVHRILTDYLSRKDSAEILRKRYAKFALGASNRATETEKRAMDIERSALDCYKAEYMKSRVGEEYDGKIISIINKGIFVGLENTVEGFVKKESLKGNFEYDGYTNLFNIQSGKSYKIGQKVRVLCVSSNVNAGNVDFEII